MITANKAERRDLLEAYNSGVVDFIRKPFDAMATLF